MVENILGKRIAMLREENRLTQLELSKTLNISNTALSQYESGNRVPSDEVKMLIADYFKVSIDWLLGMTDVREPAHLIIDRSKEKFTTAALHREDGYDKDLPDEAKKAIEEFKAFVREKYKKKD